MEKVAIFGGSFDPPHKGHTKVVSALLRQFDRVIVVTGFVTPFKVGTKTASASDRLNMLSIALDEALSNEEYSNENLRKENLEISTYETDKGGVSYSAQTVRHYSKEGRQIYFVVGSESAGQLHEWKDAEYLKENVIFYVVPREGYPVSPSDGFKFVTAPLSVPDFSSSLFKAAYALGQADGMVESGVLHYIKTHGLYGDYLHFAEGLRRFNLNESRLKHTLGAVKAGIALAKIHGESVDKAVTALMLHDVAKNVSEEQLKSLNIDISAAQNIPKECRHAIYGEQLARQYFGIEDSDILAAIRYHTTGREGMSRLEKIVALADYVEENRNFSGKDKVLSLAKTDLNAAMAEMLAQVIAYLAENNREILEISLKTLSFYRNLVYTK